MTGNAEQARRPSLLLQMLESRALPELGAYAWLYPMLHLAPRGDGHPVLVLPGFLTTGAATFPLRHFLKILGYKGHRWKLGRNLGPIGYKEYEILQRVKELRHRYGKKVSLIGWSLGGLYARELAWLSPDDVRSVITLGTPFRNHHATAVTWVYEDLTGQEQAHMLVKFDGNRVCGMTVLVSDGDAEAVVINLMGDIRPQQFSGVMAALEVDAAGVADIEPSAEADGDQQS